MRTEEDDRFKDLIMLLLKGTCNNKGYNELSHV